jgi:adenylosuccinate lyase
MAENFTAQEIAELLDPGAYTGLCAVLADELAGRVLERSHG